MNERDFEVGGRQFKLGKIDAFKQFHIVRRLGPILGDLIPVAQKISGANLASMSEEEKFSHLSQLLTPVMNGLSKLSDKDANLVLLGLCSSVEMHQPQSNNWARVSTTEVLMFQDLSLPTLLQVAGRAFMFNLSDFFPIANPTLAGSK
jgi:hypothetical protein